MNQLISDEELAKALKFKKNKINTKDYIKYTNKAMNNI